MNLIIIATSSRKCRNGTVKSHEPPYIAGPQQYHIFSRSRNTMSSSNYMISRHYSPEAASPDFDCIIPAAYNAEGSVGIVLCGIAASPLMSLKIVEQNIRTKKQ